MRQRRAQLRERRHKASVPTVALVGYTNAGKTTLFNVLTRADAEASDALFVTLDPLVRQVGCPTTASCSCPTPSGSSIACRMRWWRHFAPRSRKWPMPTSCCTSSTRRRPTATAGTAPFTRCCEEVGANDVPIVEVYNKCDAITADERRRLQDQDPAAVCISALQREGVGELVDTLASRLALDVRRVTLTFDPDDPADRERIARVYRHARVLEHETRDGRISIVADVPRRLVSRLESR